MKKKTRSILRELESILPRDNKHTIIENRANHIIESAINLLVLMEENFEKEEYTELYKRFMSSVRNRDPKRFERGIRKLKESKDDK